MDDYEALLSGTGEITVVWSGKTPGRNFWPSSAILPQGRRVEGILDFRSWLGEADAQTMAQRVADLRGGGQSFDLLLSAKDGRQVRALGWALGAGAALRVRPTLYQPGTKLPSHADDIEAILDALPDPAILFGEGSKVAFANAPYQALAKGRQGTPVEIAEACGMDLVEIALPIGKAGYLKPRQSQSPALQVANDGLAHLSAIIDALATPIAIFNANRELVQSNRAYATLWRLDPKWLKIGMDERSILDKLRTNGMLPAEPDYQAWRAKHLQSYTLEARRRESAPWHLPDGRTVQVISAPTSPRAA